MTSSSAAFAPDLFNGKRVLITGGTSGIGLGVAIAFADLGATVMATGATEEEAVQANESVNRQGMIFAQLDVRDSKAIKAAVALLPHLDIVVNAAGVIRRDTEHDPEVFSDVVGINLVGMMRVCAAAKPKLVASQGVIVNIASMLTFLGSSRAPAYSSAKGGVGQLTKSLAAAWAVDGVRVNAVAPGWIRTSLTQALWQDAERSEPILSRTPMGRWGTPEEVAGGVVFLASPAARFITGAILAIDGGYLAV